MSDQKEFTVAEVRSHNTAQDGWVIIDGKVFDISKFAKLHPGGTQILQELAGRDVSKEFNYFHTRRTLEKYAPKLQIGVLKGFATETTIEIPEGGFGEQVPYGDPSWYQGWRSPYYNDSHRRYREALRKWIDTEIVPHVAKWIENQEIPLTVQKRMGELGILQAAIKGTWIPEYYGDYLIGDVKPEEYDWFHYLITMTETAKIGHIGFLWGVFGGVNIGLPPVINFGSRYLKNLIAADCARGNKFICLAITEPWAGSDVANIRTIGHKTEDGKFYIVNGVKKWITNGLWADYLTCAVRTGGSGMGGISLICIPRDLPGVTIKKIKCQGVWGSGTSYITLENVKVPVEYLIGKEGKGFKYIMNNFNTERFGIILEALGGSRCAYEEAFKFANKRRTFGKKLIEHPVIRNKLANMIRQIEALQAWSELIAYQLKTLTPAQQVKVLPGSIALAKAQATRTFEFCAREAVQVFGGLGYTRGGQGEKVESLYRDVRALAVPGGSEEIMLDLGVRQAQKVYPKDAKL